MLRFESLYELKLSRVNVDAAIDRMSGLSSGYNGHPKSIFDLADFESNAKQLDIVKQNSTES
jgi:hypothetical protein